MDHAIYRFNHSGVLELNFASATDGSATLMYYGINCKGDFNIECQGSYAFRLHGCVQGQLVVIKGELSQYNGIMLAGTMRNLRACLDDNSSIVGQLDYVIAEKMSSVSGRK